jgi:hypothetical protein
MKAALTKSELAMNATMNALVAAGFEPAGHTTQEHVAFLVNNDGGPGPGKRAATFGGRARFVRPGTALRATVGKVTTCLYSVTATGNVYHATLDTKDTAAIATKIAALTEETP